MRLATIHTWAGPRAALLLHDHFVDLHATDANLPPSVRQLLEGGPPLLEQALQVAQHPEAVRIRAADARLHAPVPDPHKIICLGLNYKDHAAESNSPVPRDPVLFSKYATALIGHEEPIVLPRVSQEIDYEAELVLVVGKRGARHISVSDGPSYIAGYTVGHDVSARDWQTKKDGKQWMVGKTFDTFAPMGPVLVTADEIPDPHRLPIRLRLNGKTMQNSNTEQMIFRVGDIVSYLSKVLTLEPGDLIFTGTPPGVGFARTPPVWLQDGDVVEVEIEGLGTLRNPCVQER